MRLNIYGKSTLKPGIRILRIQSNIRWIILPIHFIENQLAVIKQIQKRIDAYKSTRGGLLNKANIKKKTAYII